MSLLAKLPVLAGVAVQTHTCLFFYHGGDFPLTSTVLYRARVIFYPLETTFE